jgi:hypothetical protein
MHHRIGRPSVASYRAFTIARARLSISGVGLLATLRGIRDNDGHSRRLLVITAPLRKLGENLPDDNELSADLKAVDYGYDASDAILLERKDDIRRRGLASPDDGDALALTFAYPVAMRDWAEERRFEEGLQRLKRWVV